MCGLVGMAGSLTVPMRAVMKDLLYFDTLRGADSTGVASVRRNRDVKLIKSTVPGYEFIQRADFDSLCNGGDQMWMGHNRYKTVGATSRANAHPFEVIDDDAFINLIGAHNGTLTNKWEIEKLLKGDARFGTDSETLLNLMDQLGIEEAIAEAQGAWSLTVWDAGKNSLVFVRNKERPMYLAFNEARTVVMWASETWMLLAAARRAGMELESKDGKGPLLQTSEDVMYTLEIPQKMGDVFGEIERKGGVQGKPERKFHTNHGNQFQKFWYDLADGKDDSTTPTGSESETKTETPKKEQTPPRSSNPVVYIGGPPVIGFNGQSITTSQLDEIKKKGCAWCDGPVLGNRPAFLSEKEVVCNSCLTGSEDRRNFSQAEQAKTKIEDAGKVRAILNEFQAVVKGKKA